ncbi:hypothetical protein GETHLI_24970 [Geothrix limicola]|uniref:LTXXQ motif family protein n=1 Tax=Geothrix limicola TaxID=2927978 RepID=A0ABQ5QHZ8_9BACT|nr:hypothetical protein [Geothrix limicola]GLH73995.1 hypothetical protein GETHLI_24970 [Geothrix limicola]
MPFRTALLLSLTALSLGAAQGRLMPERPRREPMPMERERPFLARRDRIVTQLHEIRTRKLQQSLGLSEEKAKSIADRWSQFDVESFARRRQMNQLRQQMNSTLMGPGSEDEKNKRITPLVGQLADLRQQQQESRRHLEDDIRSSLTPAQQGRFIILVDEFQKSLQEAIREQRRERP